MNSTVPVLTSRTFTQKTDKVADAALHKLYNEYASLLYGVIIRILKDEAMAEEALTDCFATLRTTGLAAGASQAETCRSLLTLARKIALDKVQTKEFRYQLLAKELYSCRLYLSETTPQEPVPALKAAPLPAELKSILDKIYFEGKSVAEVALKYNLTEEQVRCQLAQAVVALKSAQKK